MFCSDKYHGVILLPEGLIESIPEVYALLKVILFPQESVPTQTQYFKNIKVLMHIFVLSLVLLVSIFLFPMNMIEDAT